MYWRNEIIKRIPDSIGDSAPTGKIDKSNEQTSVLRNICLFVKRLFLFTIFLFQIEECLILS